MKSGSRYQRFVTFVVASRSRKTRIETGSCDVVGYQGLRATVMFKSNVADKLLKCWGRWEGWTISHILPKLEIMRSSYVLPHQNKMRILYITRINKISPLTLRTSAYLADMRLAIAHPNCFATSHILCAVRRNAKEVKIC